jgi:hypothetical protein
VERALDMVSEGYRLISDYGKDCMERKGKGGKKKDCMNRLLFQLVLLYTKKLQSLCMFVVQIKWICPSGSKSLHCYRFIYNSVQHKFWFFDMSIILVLMNSNCLRELGREASLCLLHVMQSLSHSIVDMCKSHHNILNVFVAVFKTRC